MYILVSLIEDHAKSNTFDFSATQLLATWMNELLLDFALFSDVMDKLPDLVSEVKLNAGFGQFELWSAFLQQGDWAGLPRAVWLAAETTVDPGTISMDFTIMAELKIL
jgi:hypothetical protein